MALELDKVAQVIDEPVLSPLPLTPPYLNTAVNAKGAVAPVLDLARFLEQGASPANGRVLVLAGDGVSLALRIDRVADVVSREQVLDEETLADEPFQTMLSLPAGRLPLISPGKLLRMLERALGGGDG